MLKNKNAGCIASGPGASNSCSWSKQTPAMSKQPVACVPRTSRPYGQADALHLAICLAAEHYGVTVVFQQATDREKLWVND